jgi:DNA replication protein DnaC
MKATTEMVLTDNLKALNLSHMLRQLEPQLRQARDQSLDYGDFLLSLTELELAGRTENRLKRRLREAKFPLLKTLETFDYQVALGLDRRLQHQLASGAYISQHRNVIFLGKSGTGKIHLATGLGVEACRQGITTRFVTGCGLANELLEARQGHTLSRIINRYARYGVLLVDELGYVPFSKEGAELLFQILAERHERRSVIITSNLGFADWAPPPHPRSLTLWRPPERQVKKRQGKSLPLRMVTCGGAQVALQQRLTLRPGNEQFIKNLNRKGGHFWLGISNRMI